MILIVEGIDKIGKTLLIKKLLGESFCKDFSVFNDLGKSVMQPHYFDNSNETDKMLKIISMVDLIGRDKNIIFDRFYWSDFSYGLIRRYYDFEQAISYFHKIDDLLYELQTKIIYMSPKNQDIVNYCESIDCSSDLSRIDSMLKLSKSMTKLKTLEIVRCNEDFERDYFEQREKLKEFIYEK